MDDDGFITTCDLCDRPIHEGEASYQRTSWSMRVGEVVEITCCAACAGVTDER